jgi:hypothetical protein
MKKLLILALLLQGCSVPQLQVASTSLLVTDWAQTQEIARNPDYIEKNPILGENPSKGRVNLYFGAAVASNLLVGEIVEEKYAKWYYWAIIALETAVITHNINMGVRF